VIILSVVQISRIQVRRGASVDLPDPLNEGEFGLTLDQGQLFIGTPNLPMVAGRVAFPYANTQVLTEWSPNIEQLLNYTYLYRTPAQPNGAATPGFTTTRSLQDRLDERVSVKEYGAAGDGATNDTFAIRAAAIDVTNTRSPNYLRALYFPAGSYNITDFVLIPPGACWIGDGIGKSVITCAQNIDCVAQTCDSALLVEDVQNDTLVDAHIEFNITTGLPNNISMMGITFQTTYNNPASNKDVVRLWRANSCMFINCSFEGVYVCGTHGDSLSPPYGLPYNASMDSVGVSIDSLGLSNTCFDINFVGCEFSGTTYGIFATDNIHEITFSQSTFTNVYRGVALGDSIALAGLFSTSFPISGINVTGAGTNYKVPPTVTITGAGTGATAISLIGVTSVTSISNPGNSYVVGDILTVLGGTFTTAATLRVTSIGGGGTITGIVVQTPGSYTVYSPNPVSVSGGHGSGAMFVVNFGVTAVNLTSAGSGYQFATTTVTLTSAYEVTVSTINSGGTGYHAPTDVITLVGGTYTSPATYQVTSTLGGVITGILMLNPGDYSVIPSNPVSVSGGSGAGASLNVTFSNATGSGATAAVATANGPTAVKVLNSYFLGIQNVAYFLGNSYVNCIGCVTAFNRYEKVGYGSPGCGTQTGAIVPVVVFSPGTTYNSSIGDTFDRVGPTTASTARVSYAGVDPNLVINPQDPINIINNQGAIIITPLTDETLLANTVTVTPTGISFPVTTSNIAFINYSLRQGSGPGTPYRSGTMMLTTDGTTVGYQENFVDLNPPNPPDTITFSATISGSNMIVQYTNTSLTTSADLKWTAESWLE
jgi:hypothetical protein